MEKKYNYTYQITNLINGKIYIGVHCTNSIDDGYMGSGTKLKDAFNKYGKENFIKDILCFFETLEEAYKEEEFIVDKEFINRRDTYNIGLGGKGRPIENHTEETRKHISEKVNEYYRYNDVWNKGKKDIYTEETKKQISNSLKEHYKYNDVWAKGKPGTFLDRNHTEETKKLMRENNIGDKNPMYGKKHNEEVINAISRLNRKDDLPMYIYRRGVSSFRVMIKKVIIGNYKTLEDAIKSKDEYLKSSK